MTNAPDMKKYLSFCVDVGLIKKATVNHAQEINVSQCPV
jgi:hypothetical protein